MASSAMSTAALVWATFAVGLVGLATAQQSVISGNCTSGVETTLVVEVGSTITPLNTGSGNFFRIGVDIKNNQLIIGLRIYFAYLDMNDEESLVGVNITSVEFQNSIDGIVLLAFPVGFHPINTDGFLLEAGTLYFVPGAISALFISQFCTAQMPPVGFPLCDDVPGKTVLEAIVEFPPGVTANDIIFTGPTGFPQVDIPACVQNPIVIEDIPVPTPVPVPAPVPELSPPPIIVITLQPDEPPMAPPAMPSAPDMLISIKSDPHIIGFRQQHLDFLGKPGSIYNIFTDSLLNSEESYTVNALIGQAYRTGMNLDDETLTMTTVQPHGTWITALGINFGGQSLIVNSGPRETLPPQDVESLKRDLVFPICSSDASSASTSSPGGSHKFCFRHDVFFNGEQFTMVGNYSSGMLENGDEIKLELKNSKSFSRVVFVTEQITANIDIVPPPTAWLISDEDAPHYSHINFAAKHVTIIFPTGVLGDTARPTIVDGDTVIDPQNTQEATHDLPRSYEEQYKVRSLLSTLG